MRSRALPRFTAIETRRRRETPDECFSMLGVINLAVVAEDIFPTVTAVSVRPTWIGWWNLIGCGAVG
jgi:hypothetical protein